MSEENVAQFPMAIEVLERHPEPRIAVMRRTVQELIGRANALTEIQRTSMLAPKPPQINLGQLILESNSVIFRSLALLLDEQLAVDGHTRETKFTLGDAPGNGKDES